MAFKTGITTQTGPTVSTEDRKRAGLENLSQVQTPVDRLGVLPTGGPTGSPGQEYKVGDSPSAPSPTNTIPDPFAELFGQSTIQEPKVRTPTPEMSQRSFNEPRPGSVVRPDQRQDVGLPVAGSVSQEFGSPIGLQSTSEQNIAYREQIRKEQIPQFSLTDTRIAEAERQVAAGERGSAYTLLDDDSDLELSLDAYADTISSGALEANTEAAFGSNSTKLKRNLEHQAKSDVRLAEILQKSDITEPGSTTVKADAARALLFTTAVESKITDRKKSEDVKKATEAVDLWYSSDFTEGVPEKEVISNLQYQVMSPTFDRQESQKNLPSRFQQIYAGLSNASDPAQQQGLITQPANARSPLSPEDQSYLTVAVFDSMKKQGLVDEVFRKDPSTGRTRGGYEKTPKYDAVMTPLKEFVAEYDEKFNVDVSITPLPGGVPVGHSSIFHNKTTRSAGKLTAGKDNTAYIAADIAGTTPFAVSSDALGLNAWFAGDVLKSKKHALGFYESQYASLFLLDKRTLFKYVPTAAEVNSDFDIEKKEYEQYLESRKSRGAVGEFRSPPVMLPSSNKDFANADEFLAEYDALFDAFSTGNEEAVAAFQDFYKRRAGPAKSIFGSVSGGYLADLTNGVRLKNSTFFYPQTIQAGTTRTQVATTTLNYQASKKARGLVANPLKYFVMGRKIEDIVKGASRTERNIVFEAIIARNLSEGNVPNVSKVDRLSSVEKQADALRKALTDGQPTELEKVARFLSRKMAGQQPHVDKWAKAVEQHIADLKVNPDLKGKDIRPDMRVKGIKPFPSFTPDVDPVADAQTMKQLAVMMDLIKEDGSPKGKSDHADFVLRSLKALGDYLENPTVQSDLIVEPDGINNGLAIQAMQFGDESYLERGGVLYSGKASDKGEITPLGDMRDLVQEVIRDGRNRSEESTLEVMKYPPETHDVWESIYEAISAEKQVKALHKAATMTVAYAHHPKFAAEGSVDGFFAGMRGSELDTFIKNEASKVGYTADEARAEMSLIEEAAIKQALGTSIDASKAIENGAGLAKVVNEIYEYKNANGWMMQLAGYESVEVASEIYIPVDGGKSSTVSTYMTFADAAAAGKSAKGSPDRKPGSKGEKQAAVMPIQGIDATVAQETMIGIHERLGKYDPTKETNVNNNFAWGAQVFDAFILDIGSYKVGVDVANKAFVDVNTRHNVLGEHVVAVELLMKKAVAKAKQYAKEGKMFDVSPDGEFRGMYYTLANIAKIANKVKLSGLEGSTKGAASVKQASNDINSKVIGFDVKGSMLTPKQFLNAITVYMSVTATLPILKTMKTRVDNNRIKAYERIRQQEEGESGAKRPVRQTS